MEEDTDRGYSQVDFGPTSDSLQPNWCEPVIMRTLRHAQKATVTSAHQLLGISLPFDEFTTLHVARSY